MMQAAVLHSSTPYVDIHLNAAKELVARGLPRAKWEEGYAGNRVINPFHLHAAKVKGMDGLHCKPSIPSHAKEEVRGA